MSRHLHIVSFNVPYPADYGGVIDVYHKVRRLSEEGVKVHLHCFTYGRSESPDLERYCEEVRYYGRNMSPVLWAFDRRPFIVSSRHCRSLLRDLESDSHPILLEGLHCCDVLQYIKSRDPGRRVIVRAHNVEHDYYEALSNVEESLLRRLYLHWEARRLKRYEPVLAKADEIWSITEKDKSYFKYRNYCDTVRLIPAFHASDKVISRLGQGRYWLYHGNLSVGENVEAVHHLLSVLGPHTEWQGVVAGRAPSPSLAKEISRYPHIVMRPDPSESDMSHLVAGSQVCVLFTEQSTGLKLKLLRSLYEGRFCLVNDKMVEGTGLECLCEVSDWDGLVGSMAALMDTPFLESHRLKREILLKQQAERDELSNFLDTL